ncbi:hypothetical protein SMC26_39400 [Actinomadura fulvescens]|uniref:Terminase n=1 Tax=Actinomadura fulvescens TaxID=46160 RepID=A0ABP6C9Q5_9ACTN
MDAVTIGPAWERDESGEFVKPPLARTLGLHAILWAQEMLRQPDGPDAGGPWSFTAEQLRFVLHWYAIDARGRFVWPYGMLQRMKGAGKDPFGAALCAIELMGPCRFGGWDKHGFPIAVPHSSPWVSTAAVSKDQTRNTMVLFPSLISDAAKERYGVDMGKEIIHTARGGRLEAVTSSPRALEGGRQTFTLKNETHHWLENNEGLAMAEVIDRNAVKSRDGSSRALAITNAHVPGENSDAERDWEAFQDWAAGRLKSDRPSLMLDSLSAPPDTDLADDDSLRRGVEAARGDAVWLDIERVMASIRDPRMSPTLSRRFYLNQVVASEDAYLTAPEVDSCAAPHKIVSPKDEIVLFFDGSTTQDTTGLVASRLADGHVFTVAAWERPAGPRGEGWEVDKQDVDRVVRRVMAERNVVAFWGDVLHFEGLHDAWSQDFGKELILWAQMGRFQHATAWDMRNGTNVKAFTEAVERFETDVRSGEITHDGDPRLRGHLLNARRRPNKFGITIGKEHRMSTRKIDLAVCAIGAAMLRRNVLASPAYKKRKKPGVLIAF